MKKVILVGCDLHEKSLLNVVSVGRGKPSVRARRNTVAGRQAVITDLKALARRHGASRIVLAYEASSLGFGLYDELTEAGIECYVLAPTRIGRSVKRRRAKTDEKDARGLLEIVRGHVLAGNEMPSIWIPNLEQRDDREVVRARLQVAEESAATKTRVQSLLKRNGVCKPAEVGDSWSLGHRSWLGELTGRGTRVGPGASQALASLLRRLAALEQEIRQLDRALKTLSESPRHVAKVTAVTARKGVGLLTAMVFLLEMGDLSRFANRRQLAAFLGLVPTCNESGEASDRKGHITRQGPSRVRKVLCQAVWSMISHDPVVSVAHAAIVARNPKKKKIATVAMMRRVAIWMWHRGQEASNGVATHN